MLFTLYVPFIVSAINGTYNVKNDKHNVLYSVNNNIDFYLNIFDLQKQVINGYYTWILSSFYIANLT